MVAKLFPSYDGLSETRDNLVDINEPNGYEYLQIVAELVEHQRLLKDRVYDMSAVVTAGSSNVSNVAISCLGSNATLLAGVHVFELWLSDATTGAGLTSTTASGTVTVKSASGEVLGTLTSKKALVVQTLATGIFTLEITDTVKTAFKVCARVPSTGLTKVLATLSGASYG